MGAPQYEQAGADIGGTGTTNTIPRWTGPSTLGDSGLIDDGTQVYTTTRNLAIGTTSAGGVKARVTGGAAGNWTAWFTGSATTGQSYGVLLDGGTNASDTALQVRSAGGSTLMFVRGDGNVGIGTASPDTNLSILRTSGGLFPSSGTTPTNAALRLKASAANAMFAGVDTASPFGAWIQVADTTNLSLTYPLLLNPNGGNVGIGTASPSAKLHVNGNAVCASGTTGMTDGFFYIPAAAGAPTGTPTAVSGRVPMYYDTTNNEFYVYNGAWKKVALA